MNHYIDLAIYNKCNNRCLICTNPTDFFSESNFSYYYQKNFLERLKKINPKSLKEISLTGGEPTLHPDFFGILDYIRNYFPKTHITLLTNGRSFYYRNFTKKLWRYKNISVEVSLFGNNPATHDLITRTKGSFKQTVSGLENLLFLRNSLKKQEVGVRIVICRSNLSAISKIIKFLKNNFITLNRVILIFMEYEGQAIVNRKKVAINYQDVAPVLKQIKKEISLFPEFRLYHFPLCMIDSYFWPYVWRTLPDYETVFLPECERCQLKKYCLGFHKGYLKHQKEPRIKPFLNLDKISIKKSNSLYHPIISVYDKEN